MLPTFVIGLREGLEAALIVGIIAAFLRQQGRRDLLRWVFAGVAVAVGLCVAVGVALEILSKNLPQQKQEGLETIVGALAVGMVTYMVIWMRRHSRELKGSLEAAAEAALEDGSNRAARAMVVMAFLAVLREGFETVVFLLAAFNETGNGAAPIAGAVLGIVIAVGLGWGIYRGGVRINLSRFFRITGLVLVVVAAGLVVTALHTAHEAGWLNVGQHGTVDLTWLVRPGTVRSSLLTGMLGIQVHPVVIEVVGWLVYLLPVGIYVGWPPHRAVARRKAAALAAAGALLAGTAALVLGVAAPAPPTSRPVTDVGSARLQVDSVGDGRARIRVPPTPSAPTQVLTLRRVASSTTRGLALDRYTATTSTVLRSAALPSRLGDRAVARLNGGRLPLGATAARHGRLPATYRQSQTVTVGITPATQQIIDVAWSRTVRVVVQSRVGPIPLVRPLTSSHSALPITVTAAAAAHAHHDLSELNRRHRFHLAAWWLLAATAALTIVGVGCLIRDRRQAHPPGSVDTRSGGLIDTQVSLT